jgi:hypothetical protein
VLLRYLGTGKQVRYWCEDESRLGLKTITSRTITLKGVKPQGIVVAYEKTFICMVLLNQQQETVSSGSFLTWILRVFKIF